MLAGVLESPELRCLDMSESMEGLSKKSAVPSDTLADELGIHILDCRTPFLPFSEFYNEVLSDTVEMDRDFANYRGETGMTPLLYS